jgi:hypothetical protein
MRKPDHIVREVVCSETGKPMPKIPLWMADIKVKFVSDEARQKHTTIAGIPDLEPASRSAVTSVDVEGLTDIDAVGAMGDADFGDIEADAEEVADEDFEE